MKDTQKVQKYRQSILDKFKFDINNFKQTIEGGKSDTNNITDYNLDQILLGMQIQMQHTSSYNTALQIVMDHLQQIPDYYDRLVQMQKTYQSTKNEQTSNQSDQIEQPKSQIQQNRQHNKLFRQIVQEIFKDEQNQCNIG